MTSINDGSYTNSTNVALVKFPQDGKSPRESFEPFFVSLCDLAASKTTLNPVLGEIGAVLTPVQYATISPVPYVILPNPGPPLPHAPAAERREREDEIKNFEKQQTAFREIKLPMMQMIQSEYLTLMSEPILRMANRSIFWIVTFLFDNYGRLTPREMEDLVKTLEVYYMPETQSFSAHLAIHINAHNIAIANGEPFSERDKVAKLRASLLPCGLFNSTIEAWAREFPTIALQTFANLQHAAQIAENNRDRLATASAYGYGTAAAAVAQPPLPVGVTLAPTTDTAQLIAQVVAASIAAMTSQQQLSKKDTSSPRLYCHTHGICSHTSQDCRTPGPKHNVLATAKNTMGGADPKRRHKRF